jgi:phage terminase small subunit
MEKPLTNKRHLAFVDNLFLNNFNATLAYKAISQDVTDNTAAVQGSKLIRNPKVVAEITRRQKENAMTNQVSKASLINDLVYIKDNQKTNNSMAALKAIEQITKMMGFNEPDKIETQSQVVTLIKTIEVKKDKKD